LKQCLPIVRLVQYEDFIDIESPAGA